MTLAGPGRPAAASASRAAGVAPAGLPGAAEVDGSEAGRALVSLERSLAAEVARILGATERDACRRVVVSLLRGAPVVRGPKDPAAPQAIAEQFLLDANGVDRVVGQVLRGRVGRAGAVALLTWLGLAESRERLRVLLGATAMEHEGGCSPAAASARSAADEDGAGHPWPVEHDGPDPSPPTLQELLAATLPEVARLRAVLAGLPAGPLPPKVRELVRLTSADTVDCRYCRNVRYRDEAGVALVDEGLRRSLASGATGDALGGSDAAAAVAVARAFLGARSLTADVVEEVRAALSHDALIDLLVTLQRFPAGSKAMVALGLVPERTPVTLL
jgi:alkylhydroperoxidase family enzyme